MAKPELMRMCETQQKKLWTSCGRKFFLFRKKVSFMVDGISWLNNWMLSINSPRMSCFEIELSVGSVEKWKIPSNYYFLEIFDWLQYDDEVFVESLIIFSVVFECHWNRIPRIILRLLMFYIRQAQNAARGPNVGRKSSFFPRSLESEKINWTNLYRQHFMHIFSARHEIWLVHPCSS